MDCRNADRHAKVPSLHFDPMVFAWDSINRDHIARHRVSPAEAEAIVNGASRPYPQRIEEDKLVVRGPTEAGRLLQVN